MMSALVVIPVQATESAIPLPESSPHYCWNGVLILAAVLAVLGFIGLLVATAERVDLHYGMGDVYMSVPLALACWYGLVCAAIMGYRGDDLLPYMQQELLVVGALFVVSFILSFLLVKRCNGQARTLGLLFATFGRLFVDILGQLFSLLTLLAGVWAIFGGRKQEGEKVSFLGRLGCAAVFAWIFNLVWGSIRTTTKEPVSAANGYLLGLLNIVCVVAALYGTYEYMHRQPDIQPSALVQTVHENNPDAALRIIAGNPMLKREKAIQVALHEGNYDMLNVIVRSSDDVEKALGYCEMHRDLAGMKDFLKAKCDVSSIPLLVEDAKPWWRFW